VNIDEINPKVAEKIVELNNSGQYSAIGAFIKETSMLAADEREFLDEQLSAYRKLCVDKLPTLEDVEKDLSLYKPSDEKMNTYVVATDPITNIGDSGVASVTITKKDPPKSRILTPKTQVTSNKALTPDEAIALMEEKLILMKHFRAISVPEFDSEIVISKKGMNLMKEFGSQFDNLVSTYIQQITNM